VTERRTAAWPAALVAVVALAAVILALPAAAHARTVWLCRPGLPNNPCTRSLNATVVAPDGSQVLERTAIPRHPKFDCFYVYPTVSPQPTPTANLHLDAEEPAVAAQQASRYSQYCRVWAPLYRQFTLAGLAGAVPVRAADRRRGYEDVRAAWRDYLAHHNHGRGVVLISHSQGTFVLRQLVRQEIENRPTVRRLLISALLLGGNVRVRKGSDVGGDFRRVRACHSPTQTGCVVAYSLYNAVPPPNSVFGRVGGAAGSRLEILCTNPAALGGGSGTLRPYVRTDPFPGVLGPLTRAEAGPLPTVPTRWLAAPGLYTARCSSAGGAHVLMVTSGPGANQLTPEPDPTWGLHLVDANLPLGNLTALVRRQAAAWLARRR
jgi:hypothetical protein